MTSTADLLRIIADLIESETETAAILADPATMAALAESDADIAAGRVSRPADPPKLNRAALRDFRIRADLTQTDLARLIPTGPGTIKQLELGTRGASKHRIAQLAEALGCSIEALTCCEGQS